MGLYEVVLNRSYSAEPFAKIDFQYKKSNKSESKLITHEVFAGGNNIQVVSESSRFAASVAGLGLMLKESAYKGEISKQMILDLGRNAISYDPNGLKKDYIELVESLEE